MEKIKYIIATASIGFFLSKGWCQKLKYLDTDFYQTFMPSHFIDHTGFKIPADYPHAIEGLKPGTPIFPVFPVYDSAGFSVSFSGTVVIPEKYLGLNTAKLRASKSNFSRKNKARIATYNTVVPEMIKSIRQGFGLTSYNPYSDSLVAYGLGGSVVLGLSKYSLPAYGAN